MANGHGGPRPGSGKPKGYRSPKRLAREAARDAVIRQELITAERTMLELARIAFADRTSIFQNGRLLPLHEWPPDAAALLEGAEIIIKNAEAGDGHTDRVHKVHLAKKLGALEILAKHFGLLAERVVHDGTLTIEVKKPWAEVAE